MNCDLKNLIRQAKPKAIYFMLDETYKNLVEMIARTQMGDVQAAYEFSELYSMNRDVLTWQLDNTKRCDDPKDGKS